VGSSGVSTADPSASRAEGPGFGGEGVSASPAALPWAAGAVWAAAAGEEGAPSSEAAPAPGSPGEVVGPIPAPAIPAEAGAAAVALLDVVIPIDVTGLGAAVKELLSELDEIRAEVEAVLPETEYAVALLGVAVGLTAYEVTRRRRQAHTQPVALPTRLSLEPT
jgi:hypothetical protein